MILISLSVQDIKRITTSLNSIPDLDMMFPNSKSNFITFMVESVLYKIKMEISTLLKVDFESIFPKVSKYRLKKDKNFNCNPKCTGKPTILQIFGEI